MGKYLLQFADIPFILTVHDSEIADFISGYFGGRPVSDGLGIQIEIEQDSKLKSTGQILESHEWPAVEFADDVISIDHPRIRGVFSIKQETGKMWFEGRDFLIGFLRAVLTTIIVNKGGIALHSSCLLKNGKAYIFSGRSGAGKSTIIKLTDNPVIFSDEVTLLKKDRAGVFNVYHSPFRSEFINDPQPSTSNIAGLYFIEQDTEVFLEDISLNTALIRILPNIFFPIEGNSIFTSKIFNLCADFLSQIPVKVMHFKKDNTFWKCIE